MEESLKQRFSWIKIANFPEEDEPMLDDIDYIFYSLNLPFRKKQLDDGSWDIEIPWVYEEACRKAFDAYMSHLLDYPKDFEYYRIPNAEDEGDPVDSKYSETSKQVAFTIAILVALYIITKWIVSMQ